LMWGLSLRGFTQEQIAERFHISQARVSKILDGIKTKLETSYNKKESWYRVYVKECQRHQYLAPPNSPRLPADLARAREAIESAGYDTHYHFTDDGAATNKIDLERGNELYTLTERQTTIFGQCHIIAEIMPGVVPYIRKSHNSYCKTLVKYCADNGNQIVVGAEQFRNLFFEQFLRNGVITPAFPTNLITDAIY
jgi:transcriptional regulator with XRE-family HTH domain